MKNRPRSISVSSLALITALSLAAPVIAQDVNPEEDEVITTGTIQQTIEQSIDFKRSQSVVSDALIGAELGDLPDLSIAESLERIVGVTSDRFKGGASELSVRGLGAFLGSSVFNGREISSGSDGRDVNFGQFPSELINGALVYKTQQADFIEGGISGIIGLQTLRPLDYNKRRIQLQGLIGYAEYEDRVDEGDPFNERLTASYVDQFKDTGVGDIGIAIGGQLRRDTAPEDIFTTSSSYRPCSTIWTGSGSSNCSFDPDNTNSFGTRGAYLVSNQYIYRAMATETDRDAIMGNLQWQPNAEWDVNFDMQWSDRFDLEERANLVVADGRRRIVPIDVAESGALLAWEGESRLENQSVYRTREEEYVGLGLNAEWTRDKWVIAADVGYSKTERRQDELDMRIRTNRRVDYRLDRRNVDVPVLTLLDVSAVEANTGLTFDLNNHDLYTNGARARRRLENNDDEILSARLDFDRAIDGDGLFNNLGFGVRYAERKRMRDDGIDSTIGGLAGFDSAAVVDARRDRFIVEDLYEGANTVNTDVAAGIYAAGLTFATWDPEALFVALTGSRDAGLTTGSTLSPDDVDIKETTYAAYLQADFESTMGNLPIYGNIGARIIHTDIESTGINTRLTRVDTPGMPGFFNLVPVADSVFADVRENSFINVLPSANLTMELSENKLLRLAAYSAIARPDPSDLSGALTFDQSDDGFTSTEQIISAGGNPFLEPLESTNFDVSFEWYPTESSIFSLAGYYKILSTGFENEVFNDALNIDGADTPVTLIRSANNDDSSGLLGFEIAMQHKFENLPGLLSGFGLQAAYNYADSNFEFPDPTQTDGTNFLADFIPPANISGYSKHTGNVTLFWENDRMNLRLAYKARSNYFKPFRTSALRFTDGQQFLDASASYDLTENLELRVQALNLTDEPNVFFRPVRDSLAQADYSGRRYFVGLRARF